MRFAGPSPKPLPVAPPSDSDDRERLTRVMRIAPRLPIPNESSAQSSRSTQQQGVLQMTFLKRFLKDEGGATAIEYGLIAALIAVVIIGAVQLLGENIDTQFNTIATAIGGG
jgi:pilus assembly protein Flp/PilA